MAVRIAVVLPCLALAVACSAGHQHGSRHGSAGGDTTKTTTSSSGGAKQSVGEFTAEFARCMRANGVPNFPDPNGTGGQLGPGSGVDIGSAAYQNAINGPCHSLAPPAWVSVGPGSAPTGSPQ
jgi:hypothetical protein